MEPELVGNSGCDEWALVFVDHVDGSGVGVVVYVSLEAGLVFDDAASDSLGVPVVLGDDGYHLS